MSRTPILAGESTQLFRRQVFDSVAEEEVVVSTLVTVKPGDLASALTDGSRYKTIVIDPPWPMTKIKRACRPNQCGWDYPTMSLKEIAAFPLADLMEDECHVYLWTTQKFVPAAFDVLDHWGLDYLFTMVWHKPGGFQPVGMPQFNHESIVVGRRGPLAFLDTNWTTCFKAPRREHSRKPDQFYDLVRWISPPPRIDVFSRERRAGFAQYGNETDTFNEIGCDVPLPLAPPGRSRLGAPIVSSALS